MLPIGTGCIVGERQLISVGVAYLLLFYSLT